MSINSFISFLFLFTLKPSNIVSIKKYLYDSHKFQYEELNWNKETSSDSTDKSIGWIEQSFNQIDQVLRVHSVCDIESRKKPDNWLRLPYIQRKQTDRYTIYLEYTIRDCKKYSSELRSCQESFQLFYLESDNSTPAPAFSESNYKYLKTITSNNDSSQQIQLSLRSTKWVIYRTEIELSFDSFTQGVYLAFRDQGACMSLLAVKIYYTLCPTLTNGNLIVYSQIPTRSNDLVKQIGRCVPNSNWNVSHKYQPIAYCKTNGEWLISNDNQNMCLCLPGYYYSKSKHLCIECPPGTYKPITSNWLSCLKCPLNSLSKTNSSQFCSCLDGFYRVNSTDLSSNCIQYPNEIKNLIIYYLDQTSVKLKLNQLAATDTKYKLECFKCLEKDNFVCKNKQPCESNIKYESSKENLTEVKISLTALESNTQYLVKVYAQTTKTLFKTKKIEVLFRTLEDINSLEVYNLTAYRFVELEKVLLMWSDGSLANLTTYELRYWLRNDSKTTNLLSFKTSSRNFVFKSSISNLDENFMFQLRIKSNSGGWGPFTLPIEAIPINTKEATFNTTSFNQITKSRLYYITSAIIIFSVTIFVSLFVLVLSLIYFKLIKKLTFSNLKTTNRIASVSTSIQTDSDLSKQLNNAISSISLSIELSSTSSLQNTFQTYINPHTYEDPTRLVGLFAKELSPFNIQIDSIIGSGEFGDVCKGCLRDSYSSYLVAIKTLKGCFSEQNRCDFLTEASIMVQFYHTNVIKLEGVVTLSNPLMIVTEYMENGSLDLFLKQNKNQIRIEQMIKMLRDVASGMSYLSDMNFIHRDLAARNVLVDSRLICKVADFGLSRLLDSNSLEYTSRGGKIPIRWTSPEAITFRSYSWASDVWSFGVLAYEVLSYGERPYWNWENSDVIKAVQASYRLPAPRITPDCLYKLMLKCWNNDRLLRPRFYEILSYLDEVIHLKHELNTPSAIKELMPINPYEPTVIQLTSTKQFLTSLKLDHYLDLFYKNNLSNLSNLFILNTNDLTFNELKITNEHEQKLILKELNQISKCFMNLISSKHNNYINDYNSTIVENNDSEVDCNNYREQSYADIFITKSNEFIV